MFLIQFNAKPIASNKFDHNFLLEKPFVIQSII